jgi:two-component system chemotaxis response regulator CheY
MSSKELAYLEQQKQHVPVCRTMRILLVDDDRAVRKTVRNMLERAGHGVVEAENGLEGIERLKSDRIELILTDLVMPVMDGLNFIKTAHCLIPSVKIIAMSGGARTGSTDLLETAMDCGATMTVQKPFTSVELQSAIDQCGGTTRLSPI